MSKSPFSRSELIPQEERLWVNHSKARLVVSFAKASTLQERRVAITPEGVKQLCQLGHEIIIEKDLGLHAGYGRLLFSLPDRPHFLPVLTSRQSSLNHLVKPLFLGLAITYLCVQFVFQI